MGNYNILKNILKVFLDDKKFKKIFKNSDLKNINLLIGIPNPKMIIYCCSDIVGTKYFDTLEKLFEHIEKVREYDNISSYEISSYEYLGSVFERDDVIRKTIIGKILKGKVIIKKEEDRKSVMISVSDIDGIEVYNERMSIYSNEFIWEYQEGVNLQSVYNAFKERGLEFKKNIYDNHEDVYKILKKELIDKHWY